jgi:hypothetical protein
VAVYALLGAAAVYVLVRNLDSVNDFGNFLPFGVAALAGLDPYTPEMVDLFGTGPLWSTWPPSFAPVAATLARLEALAGWPATVVLWQAAGLGAVALVLAVWTRWLYGRRLSLRGDAGGVPLHSAAALAGLLVPARLVLSNFEHNQVNLVVLGLAVAGLWLFRRGRRWGGGMAVGLATAFKATPLLLLPYLAWRGRWRDVAASAAGCAAAWLLLPALLLGPAEAARWYDGWLGFVGELPLPVVHSNQSFQAAVSRVLGAAGPKGHAFGAGPLGAPGVRGATAAGGAVAALAAAVAFGRPGRTVSARREALEAGAVFALMALFSPVAWKHHFAVLLPVSAALWARTPAAARWTAPPSASGTGHDQSGRAGAGRRPRDGGPAARGGPADGSAADGGPPTLAPGSRASRVLYAGLAAAALAINGTATGLVGGGPADRFEHWGVVTWSAAALTALALWLLWRERRAA